MRHAISLAVVLALTSCAGGLGRVKPQPPFVSPCLDEPQALVPDEPEAPDAGAPITDTYVRDLKGWGNALLGVITSDRIAWRGERRCIRKLQDVEQIR